MEAHFVRAASSAIFAFVLLAPSGLPAQGAGYRTTNFTVDAPTPELAKEIGDMAEHWRTQLAQEWLGKELPPWSKRCPIKAIVRPGLGAGGETSFVFDRGHVFGWRMQIQGSRQRILDSVLPHEITHTIFASHFRRPLPRWADEGACTTVEHVSEVSKMETMLIKFLRTRKGIPFSNMFAMKEYPKNVLPLYAQGHSVAKFLISQYGKRKFLDFLADGLQDENWPLAVSEHFGHPNLLSLQNTWMDWVRAGRPEQQLVAGANRDRVRTASNDGPPTAIVRGQNPSAPVSDNPPRPQSERPQNIQHFPDPSTVANLGAPPVADVVSAEPQEWPRRTPRSATAQSVSVYDTRGRGGSLR
ncbi:MAG: hypothetical protein MK171_10075 [Pirellulales bacterium]|nr:hypothetical protein [Pirellulales bacterium]